MAKLREGADHRSGSQAQLALLAIYKPEGV